MRNYPIADTAAELVIDPTPLAPATTGNMLSRLARRARAGLENSRRPIIIWLSHKMRLTINPRPTRRLSRLTLLLLLPFVPSLVQALPAGEQVVGGQATIARPTPQSLTVKQETQKVAIDWRNFSIARGESVVFNQPNAQAVALNRVLSGDPSHIFGSLKANGSVFLVNSAGVYFAPGAAVNVGSFVGSTLSMSTQDFMAGNYRFTNNGNAAGIENQGSIQAQNGGYIALLGPQVSNSGSLQAHQGSVALAAGNRVTLAMGAGGMLNVNVDASALQAKIENKGDVIADGGQVHFTARSADALLDTVINTSGTVRASSLQQRDGKIILDGGSRGVVQTSGKLDTASADGKGGTIKVLGDKIAVSSTANLDASGKTGGGEILVGGNFQGKGTEQNASKTIIAAGASIKADALENGDGGKVIVWADDRTRFEGSISAKGGAQGGNGGLVETSGKQTLSVSGAVDASAAQGKGGTWLLDPHNITISTGTKSGIDDSVVDFFTGNGDSAVLNNTTLNNALKANTHVIVQTGGTGTQSGNITVDAPITAAGADATLSLNAEGSIELTSNAQITTASNKFNVNLNAGMNAGTAGINPSSIKMDANASIVTKEGYVTATAKGDITLGQIDTSRAFNDSGNVTLKAEGAISQLAALTAKELSVTNTGGSTTLNSFANSVSKLGTITATGQTFSLDNSLLNSELTQTGVLTAGRLDLNHSQDIATLDQANKIDILGNIDLGTNNFSLTNATALKQVPGSTLTVATLKLTNTVGNTDLSTGTNAVTTLGEITSSGGSFSFTNTDKALVTSSSDINAGAHDVSINTGTGTFTAGTGKITAGNLSLTANNMALSDLSYAGVATLTVAPATTNRGIDLNGSVSGSTLGLDSTAVSKLYASGTGASNFVFGSANTGTITLKNALDFGSKNLKLQGGSISNENTSGRTITASKVDFVTNGGGAVGATGSGRIRLSVTDVSVNTTNGDAFLNASGKGYNIKASDLGTGVLNLTAGGSITQDGVIKASSLAVSNSGSTTNLGTQANEISSLGAITSSTFSIQTTKALTQSAGMEVTTLNVTNSGGATTLTNSSNKVTNLGTVSSTAGDFSLSNGNNSLSTTNAAAINAGTNSISLSTGTGSVNFGNGTVSGKNLTVTSDVFDFNNFSGAGVTGTITWQPTTTTQAFDLGDVGSASVFFGPSEISSLKNSGATDIVLGASGGTGAVTIEAAVNLAGKNLTINGGAISDEDKTARTITATSVNFVVSGSSSNTVGGSTSNNAIDVIATNVSANTTGGSAYIVDTSTTNVTTSNVGAGTFSLTSAGAVTQSGGAITAGKLAITNTDGATDFSTQANKIADLGTITATGQTFSLQNDLALTQSGVLRAGTLVLNNTAGATTLDEANRISNLGNISSSAGNFSLTNTGSSANLTVAGTITATAKDVSISTGSNTLTFATTGAVTAANFNATTSGAAIAQSQPLNVTGASSFTAGAAAITLSNASNTFGGDVKLSNSGNNAVSLVSSGAISLGTSSVGTGTLTVTAGGDLSQTGSLTQASSAGAASFGAGANNITLANTSNSLTGTVSLSNSGAKNTSLYNNRALALGTVGSGSGTLSLTSVGALTQTGAITQEASGGAVTIAAGAGAITLGSVTNDVTGPLSLSNSGANNVSFKNTSDLAISSATLGTGTLSLTTAGSLSQTGAITQSGGTNAVTLTVGSGKDIALGGFANSFLGAVTLAASSGNIRDVALKNISATAGSMTLPTGLHDLSLDFPNSAITLPTTTLTSGGSLSVTAGGAIAQSGVLTVPGTTTINAGANTITLNTSSNALTGAVSLNNSGTKNVGLKTSGALELATSSVGNGTLSIEAAGNITQSGALTQASGAGATSFTAGANAITLTQNNEFTGVLSLSNSGANNVAVTDSSALSLGTLSLGSGTLDLTAGSGITQASAITASGKATIDAGAGVLTLGSSNNFSGTVVLKNSGAHAVTFKTTGALDLGASTVGSSTSSITAGGDISQSGAFIQAASAGATTFNAGANKITLTNASNDITGTLQLENSGAKDVAVVTVGALKMGTSNVGTGTLSLTAAGDITQPGGPIKQAASAGAVSVTAGANAISLTNSSNSFTGEVSLSNSTAKDVSLTTAGALKLGTVAVGAGALAITSNGALTQSGPITQEAGGLGVTINAGAGAITLSNTSNDFKGALGLTNSGSNNVSIYDVNTIDLAASSVGQNLSVQAKGNISQSGALEVEGTTTATIDTVTASVDLSKSDNSFTGNVKVEVANGGSVQDVGIGSKNGTANAIGLPLGTTLRDLTLNFSTAAVVLPATTLSRNLTVTARGVTQSGLLTVPGTTTINAGANDITLNSFANVLGSTVTLNNSGAKNTALKTAGALELGASSVGSGTLSIEAAGAITQTGALTQAASAGTATFTAGTNAITLTNASNDFTGAVSLNNSAANNVAITDVNALKLGASSIGSGSFTVLAAGAITQSGSVTQAANAGATKFTAGANAITLSDASNSLTGTIDLSNSGNNNVAVTTTGALKLGTLGVGSGSLGLTSNGNITQTGAITQEASAGAVTVTAGTGAITLEHASNAISGTVSLNNSAAQDVSLNNNATLQLAASSVGKNLSVQAAGNISQSGALTVAGTTTATVNGVLLASVDLSHGNNDFGGGVTIAVANAGTVQDVGIGSQNATPSAVTMPTGTLRNLIINYSQAAVDLAATTLTGNLSVTAGGNITQSGKLDVPGTTSINAGAHSITLGDATNDLGGAVSLSNSGNFDVTLKNAGALSLGTIAVGSGNLAVTAGGEISQSGTLTQAASAGSASFTAGANKIDLSNASNDFTGAVSLNNSGANNVVIKDTNALKFGSSSVGTGTLSITAGGAITQSAGISQAAAAGTVTVNAGANAIDLSKTSNSFTGAVELSNSGANNVALGNSGALNLGTTNVGSGTLSVTSGGALSQSGVITQAASAGAASFDAGANSLTLNNASNSFTGAVGLNNSGNNAVTLSNSGALNLGTSSVGTGSVSITSTGDVTQSAAFVQAASGGTVSVNAGANAVTLDNSSNDFTGALSITNSGSKAVSVVDSNSLTLGTLSVGDASLSVKSNGALSQSGTITQSGAGAVTLNAGAGSMALNGANTLLGAVSLNNTGANNVSLNNAGALDLGVSAVGSGTLSVTAAGAISQSGKMVQAASAGTATFNAGANSISLTNSSNDFTGAVALNNSGSNDVSLKDANALALATSSVGKGNLSVTSGGALTQTGAITQAAGATSATFNAGANTITLDSSNSFTSAVSVNNSGANDVSLKAAGALQVAASSVGKGALTITSGGALSQTGAITQTAGAGATTFNAGANTITLTDASNSLQGAVSLNNSGANAVSVNNNAALKLGTSSVGSSTLSVTANGGISQSGGITQAASAGAASFSVGANSVDLSNASNDFTGAVAISNSGSSNVSVRDSNALNVGTLAVGSGTLDITAAGDITQSGAITQTGSGAVTVNAGANAITLSNASNDFKGALSVNNSGAKNVEVVDANALNLAASTVGQNLDVTAGAGLDTAATVVGQNMTLKAGGAISLGSSTVGTDLAVTANGNITQTAALKVTGTATFTVDTATAATVALGSAANTFGGISIGTSNGGSIDDVSVRNTSASASFPSMGGTVKNLSLQFDATGIQLPGLTLGGNLNVITAGDISQAAALKITGTSSFNAGANNITLNNSGNAFTGALTLANSGAKNVALTAGGALDLASVAVGSGTLSLTSGGDLSQSGSIVQAASAGAVTLNAGANKITLNHASNDFTGAVGLNNSGAKDIVLKDVNALQLGASNIGSGSLTVTAGGDLSQGGALLQSGAGAASFSVGAHAISLNASNDFKGAVSLTNSGNHNVTLVDANTLDLGRIDVGSVSLSVTANGAISQSAKITQEASAGAVSINAGAGSIALNDATNSFTGAVGLNNSGNNNVSLVNSGGLILGTSSIGTGSLTITASGDLTQTGPVVQTNGAGATSITVGANQITLNDASNRFTGALNLSNSGNKNVSVNNIAGLNLGTVGVGSGTLDITASGDITQSGTVVQAASAGKASFNAGANAITLNASNDFTGSVSLSNSGAKNVVLNDVNSLSLAKSDLGTGSLTVTAAGAITQTGAITQAASAGAASFSAGANAITLSNAGNDFTGALSVSNSGTNNVAVTDANSLSFGTSSIGQDMTIVAGSSVVLGNMTVGRNLDVSTGANVTQTTSTGLTVLGTSTFTTTGSDADILLDGTNDFNGKVKIAAGSGGSVKNVTVRNIAAPAANPEMPGNLTNLTLQFDNAALNLPATSVSGSLSAIAGGDITQSGALSVGGSSTFSAGAHKITLDNVNNDFVGAVSLLNSGANAIAIADKNALIFGTSSIGSGSLTASALAGGITQTGAIKQAASAAATSFSASQGVITLTDANNDLTGPLNLTNTGLNAVAVSSKNAMQLGSVSIGSSLALQAGGNITQTQALTTNGSASFTIANGSGDVLLNNSANDFTGKISVLAGTGGSVQNVSVVNVNGAASSPDIPATGVNDLSLQFDNAALNLPAVNIGGNLSVKTGGAITQSGSLVIGGTSNFNAKANPITLNDLSNSFTGAVSLNNTGANNISVKAASALALGTSNVGSGSLTLNAGGKISQSGALVQSAGAGAVSLTSTGDVEVNNAGNDFIGAVSVNTTGSHYATITDSNAVLLGASTVGQNLAVTAGGNITQSGALKVGGTSSFSITGSAADISLASQANDLSGSVSFAGNLNDVELRNISKQANLPSMPATSFHNLTFKFDNAGVTLPATTLTGELIIEAGGDINQSGKLIVPGKATLTAGGKIDVSNAANDFGAEVALSNSGNNNVLVSDVNALQLAAANLGSGSFTVSAGGAISQTGAIVQAASATGASFSAAANSITLNHASNNLTGPVSLNNSGANDISLNNAGPLSFATSNVGSGKFAITASGAISQTGAITQAASAGAASFDAGANAITLANANNSLTGAVGLKNSGANNVALTNKGALQLDTSNVGSGTLALTAGGAITQNGALTQATSGGAVTVNAGANAITLSNVGNDFTGAVGLNNSGANNVAITDSNALALGSSVLGSGTLSINASGAITQTGALVQSSGGGAVNINAAGNSIALNQALNDFTGAVSLNNTGGNDVSLTDANALILAASNVGSGNLQVTSSGALTQTGALVQASGAGTASFAAGANAITLNNIGNQLTGAVSLSNSGSNNIILVDAVALKIGTINAGSGSLNISSNGAMTQVGPITQAASAGAVTLTAGSNSITLTNVGNDFTGAVGLSNSGANNVAVVDANDIALAASSVGSGSLSISAAGAISQNGSISQANSADRASFTAGSSIRLSDKANNFTGAVSVNNGGANNVELSNGGPLQMASSNVGSGTLSVTAAGPISQSGAVVQAANAGDASFDAGANSIALTHAGNDFTGTVLLRNTGSNDVSVTDANTLRLGGTTIGKNLAVVAGGHITQSGTLVVAGTSSFTMNTNTDQDVKLASFPNDFGGTVTISNGTGSIADVELRNVHPNSSGSGSLTLPSRLRNLTLTYDNSSLAMSGATLTGKLDATAGGAISQTGPLVVPGTASFNAGANAITLNDKNNDFGDAVSLTNTGANDVALTDLNALKLGRVDVGSGNLTVSAGAITQTAAITQGLAAGRASFSAGTNAITLTHADNDFTGALSLNNSGANNIAVKDKNALILGASSVGSGSLVVTAGGALSQASTGGIVQAAGTGGSSASASFSVGANSINLSSAENDFTGPVTLSNSGGNDVALRDANSLSLAASNLGSGALNITSNGALSQTGALVQDAAAGQVTINAGAGTINLSQAGNSFSGAVSLNNSGANNVSLNNNRALQLAASTLGAGQLNVTAQGAISQNGAIKQSTGGSANFNAGANSINLSNAGNDFTGAVSLNNSGSNDVSLVDSNALVLGASSVGSGNLSISAGGKIDQTGALVQAASTNTTAQASINAGSNAITLTASGNDFTTPVSLTGGDVQLVDKNGLQLAKSTISGNLDLNSTGGNISQTAAISVKGNTNVDAGSGEINLNQANNDFNTVSLNAAKANVVDVNDLGLSGSVSGNLSSTSKGLKFGNTNAANLMANASGSVTQNDGSKLIISGTTNVNASGNSVNLTQANNDFNEIDVKASSASVTDVNALSISATTSGDVSTTSTTLRYNASTIGGNLQANANGAVSQTGALKVTGSSTIAAGANAVTLLEANDFKGAVAVSNSGAANAVQLADSNALVLGNIKTDGNLVVNAVGISQASSTGLVAESSAVIVGGNAELNGGAGAITLEGAKNDFQGVLSLNNSGSNAVSINDANALQLGASNIGGNVKVLAAGALTQTAALKVAGSSSFEVGNNSITLNSANEFGGKVGLTGAATQVTAAKILDANLKTTGATNLVAGTELNVAGSVTGAGLTTNAPKTVFAASTIEQGLTINATGPVTQTAAIKVGGATSIKASSGTTDLSNAGNDFVGAVSIEGSANVSDVNALNVNLVNGGDVSLLAGGALDVAGKSNNLNTSAVGKSQFGNISVLKKLAITTLGGDLVVLDGKLIDAPEVNLIMPKTYDLGSTTNQFSLNNVENVLVLSGHNSFLQIPLNTKVKASVKVGSDVTGCVRVNLGSCINGSTVISGAISAVQSGATSGLVSKLQREDASTKKLAYGFTGDLQQAQSYPHEGALEIKPLLNCRTGNTIGNGSAGGLAVQNGVDCGSAKNGELQEKMANGFTGDLQQAKSLPHEGAIELKTLPECADAKAAEAATAAAVTANKPDAKAEAKCIPAKTAEAAPASPVAAAGGSKAVSASLAIK